MTIDYNVDGLGSEYAFSNKFIVPARRNHCFGLLLFEKFNGSNAKYTQIVGESGFVVGFERFVSDRDLPATQLEDEVKVAVGDLPKVVFVLDEYNRICGNREEICEDLNDILPALHDEPLVALSVAKMCVSQNKINSYTMKAFDFLRQHNSLDAAEIWRDQMVILPVVRDEIQKMMASSYDNEVLRVMIDRIMYSDGKVSLEESPDFVFNARGQRMISDAVFKRIPKQFRDKRLKFINSFFKWNRDSDQQQRAYRRAEQYGPFYILGSKGFKLDRTKRDAASTLLLEMGFEKQHPHTTVRNGTLPRGRAGLEFYTSNRPSSDPSSELVEWDPEEDNVIDIKIERGRMFAELNISVSDFNNI